MKKKIKITPEMTATSVMLQRDAMLHIKRMGRICEALLTGKIDSRVVSYAEQYLYVNKELLKKK